MELSDIAVFVKVVQAGSFTEAARRLGAPKSTVSSKVSGLESRLGVTLLQRTTRKLHLTEEGGLFFQTCARALSEIESAEAVVAGRQQTPQGRVSVTAPNDMGKQLAGFLKMFLGKYPEISVDLILTNRYVDLVGEGIDVAIRAGALSDSSLIAKKILTTSRGLFASPAYLARAGTPTHPKDLVNHRCILFGGSANTWRLLSGKQEAVVKVAGAVSADDLSTLRELAVQGLGIALIPSFISHAEVAAKKLVAVVPGWVSEASVLCIVYPGQKFQHPKIKIFIDELAEALRHNFRVG